MPRLETLVVLLLLFTVLRLNAIELSFDFDSDSSTTCGDKELCWNSTNFSPVRHCQCDSACPVYGDCCRDSPRFRIEDTQSSNFACIPARQDSKDTNVFVKELCPDDWHDLQVRQACQQPKREDPLVSQVPITDISTMLTYRNAYCARCNNANTTALQIWQAELRCYNVHEKRPNGTNFVWEPTWKKWVISENGTKYPCKGIIPVVPPHLERVRNCPSENIVRKCGRDWINSTEQELCSSFTAYITVKTKVFQNIYCAVCNGESVSNPSCEFPDVRPRYSGPPSLRLLLDFEFGANGRLGMTARACESTLEVYDPFFKKCRRIFSIGVASNNAAKDPVVLPSPQEQCDMVVLDRGEFVLSSDNSSVWVESFTTRYYIGEFSLGEDGKAAICVTELNVMGVVTYVGLGVSAIFLILHLCAVALVPDLRNLSGNTLASLCVALLFAYMSFMTGGFVRGYKTLCKAAAAATYYFFLASFAWMLVLGFDVWRALTRAIHFQVCRGGQWRRFLAYSLFSWLTPGLMTILTLAFDRDSVNEWLRPGFGLRKCWFSRTSSAMIFYGSPVVFILSVNVGFFVCAARIAMGARPGDSRPRETGAKRDFRLYVRLAVMFGLTWFVGLVANLWDKEYIWVTFTVLNTLQGLFIFIMFTCTAKVARSLIKQYSWAQSIGYSMSKESRKSTATKSSSLTRASSDTLPGSGSGSNSDTAAQEKSEKSAFLQNALTSRTSASYKSRTSDFI